MKASIRSEWIGRTIDGQFPLLSWVGGSAHSAVFLTHMPGRTEKQAAIKFIPLDQIEQDVSILSRTTPGIPDHPYLLKMLYTGHCVLDGQSLVYVVTAFADEVLSSILPERPLTAEETQEMLGPVLDALAALHESGFVLTRLKPSNILVAEDRVQVAADGACFAGALGRSRSQHTIYDAPEMGSLPFSAATDMWSLGATLVETLTQEPLDWNRAKEMVPKVPHSVPEPFSTIARGCLLPQPSQRPSLNDVRAALAGQAPQRSGAQVMLSGNLGSAATPFGPERTQPAAPRRRARAMILAAAAVLVVVIAVLQLHSHRETSSDTAASAASTSGNVAAPAATPVVPAIKSSPAHRYPAGAPTTDVQAPTSSSAMPVHPGVAKQVLPKVLPAAQASIQGTVNVVVTVLVDSAGRVTGAELKSPGPSRYFARISTEAAQQWLFAPAENDSSTQPRTWDLHFVYRQDGMHVIPAPVAR